METVTILPTPNPNAIKFILDQVVKSDGKSDYRSSNECKHNRLAAEIFKIEGVEKLHFFRNTITVTKIINEEWNSLEARIENCIKSVIASHDPNYEDISPEDERRKKLPPKIREIEEILDKTVRPALQNDGGDLKVMELISNCVVISYEGACGTCPSAQTGTLHAIQSVLRKEFDPEIVVMIDPET